MKNVNAALSDLISVLSTQLSAVKLAWIQEYVKVGEYGLAVQLIADVVFEEEASVDEIFLETLRYCADQTRTDIGNLEKRGQS